MMAEHASFSSFLQSENQAGRAVAAFNVYNLLTIRAAVQSAANLNRPVIVALGEKYLSHMTPTQFVSTVNAMTERHPDVLVWIHLDHAKNPNVCMEAIAAGFNSVMIDASDEPFDDNVKLTRDIVECAHARGVGVEAELGGIGVGDGSHEFIDGSEQLTDPDDAAAFVEATGVDALAVSIGTVHGFYRGTPNIDTARLAVIRERVQVPLVLHGGSGTPVDVIRKTIGLGISKINVNTELSAVAVKTIQTTIETRPTIHLSELELKAQDAALQVMTEYMKRFDVHVPLSDLGQVKS